MEQSMGTLRRLSHPEAGAQRMDITSVLGDRS
jgi:hypothetical protein